jgi:hypothetical protein
VAIISVFRARQGGNEDAHDLVADELVDDPVMRHQDPGGDLVEPLELATELGRADRFGHRRRPTDIGEEEACVELGTTVERLEDAEACPAVLGVLRPSVPTHEMHQERPRLAERSGTHLAAR